MIEFRNVSKTYNTTKENLKKTIEKMPILFYTTIK